MHRRPHHNMMLSQACDVMRRPSLLKREAYDGIKQVEAIASRLEAIATRNKKLLVARSY